MDLVPKAIRDSIGFAFLRSVIGLENSRHSLKCKTKTKTNHDQERILSCHDLVTRVFPRFWHLACFNFEFSLVLEGFFSWDRYDYFGFGFTSVNRKAL